MKTQVLARSFGVATLMAATFVVAMPRVASLQGGAAQAPPAGAQQPPPGGAGQGRGGGGGGGGRSAFGPPTTPTRYDDYTGFTKIWDGATFTNWDGERDVWSIADGMLHADTTKTPGQHHIIYRGPGALMRDFTLKVEFRISAMGANGGIQYRSRLLHATHGGSIADPFGKPIAPNITTVAEAIAAGIVAAPAARGGAAGGGGNPAGGGGRAGGGAPPAAGAPPASAPPAAGARAAGAPPAGAAPAGGVPAAVGAAAAPAANPCVGEVGNLSAPATAAPAAGGGRGNANPGALPGGNPWQVSGYQFDLDSDNQYTGQLYEGQGRNIITSPGTIGMLLPGNCKILLGKLPGDVKAAVKPHRGLDGEWQQVEIIARGNTMIHILNGTVMSITIDDDPAARAWQGILSLQLEGTGQIWYRNVYLKLQDKSLDFPK